MKTIGRDFGDVARKVYATASGALPNGKPVAVNSDGTVSLISGDSIGSESVFESIRSDPIVSTFDSNSNKVVIAYGDYGNSYYGTAVVGTVSGTSITFGTPVVFNSGTTVISIGITFDSNSNKAVIVYRNNSNSYRGTAIVGTVSGTNISFGTAVVYASSATGAHEATFDSNSNKVVIVYYNEGNSNYGTAIVGTVSGTGISFGSAVVYESAYVAKATPVFDSNSNKIVIAYRDGGNSNHGTAIVGTVSSTSISFGSAVVYHAGDTPLVTATFDSNSNKVVIVFRDDGDGQKGKAIVGTVSGTGISFGSEVEWVGGRYDNYSAAFNSTDNKVLIFYDDYNDSGKGKYVKGQVSGTTISFTSSSLFHPLVTTFISATYDSNSNRIVTSYRDDSNQDHGTSVVLALGSGAALTSENYIGMTPSAYPSGAGAEIDTKGAINTEQSGLTAGQSYYVQNDGTIGTTAGDPSVFAGTAVSATKLIVKG